MAGSVLSSRSAVIVGWPVGGDLSTSEAWFDLVDRHSDSTVFTPYLNKADYAYRSIR